MTRAYRSLGECVERIYANTRPEGGCLVTAGNRRQVRSHEEQRASHRDRTKLAARAAQLKEAHGMERLRPLANHVVVRREATEEVTQGGIMLSEFAQRKSFYGTVVAVGPGKHLPNGTLVPMEVRVGDRVLLSRWKGTELEPRLAAVAVERGSEKLVVVQEDDVYAVVA